MLDNAGLYVLSHTHRVTVTVHCLWKQIASFCTEVFSIPVSGALIPVSFLPRVPPEFPLFYWAAEDRQRPCYILGQKEMKEETSTLVDEERSGWKSFRNGEISEI